MFITSGCDPFSAGYKVKLIILSYANHFVDSIHALFSTFGMLLFGLFMLCFPLSVCYCLVCMGLLYCSIAVSKKDENLCKQTLASLP